MKTTNPEIRTEIYTKRSEAYDREEERLEAWQGQERNKELIRAYQQFLFVKGSQKLRVAKLTGQLRRLCNKIIKPLDTLTKDDVDTLVSWINQNEAWTVVTRADYRRAIKEFYHWFEDEDCRLQSSDAKEREEATKFYKYLRRYVKSTYQKRALDYSSIITEEDAQCIIQYGCQNTMERAIFAVLHETGCRIGELLNLRLRDIERKGKYAMLRLDGKTGERRVPIMQCTPYLYQWIADHSHKDNPNALLWISKSNRYHGEPLAYIGIDKLLKRSYERAGIKKKRNAHWLRHSRATILASKYSEQILCKLMGWTTGSKQVATYVHLSAGQVEDAFLKVKGLTEISSDVNQMQYCVCGTTNTATSRYCFKCGNALSVATVLEDEGQKKAAIDEADRLLIDIMGNPEKLKRFQEILKTMNGGRT